MTATSIEWTDVSWNPTRGCSRVSAGCENCYAEGVARRFAGPGMPYEGLVRLTKDGKAKAQWSGEVRFIADKLADPLTWKKPKRVFVNSMSDLFHDGVSFEQIAATFGVMAAAPQHTFQVLTKRPERALAFFEWCKTSPASRLSDAVMTELGDEVSTFVSNYVNGWSRPVAAADDGNPLNGTVQRWPLANVWLGASVEDQASADKRIPHLLACPAAVRWVSYEPALEAVDFDLPRCGTCGRVGDASSDDGAPWCSEHDEECSYGHWLDFAMDDGSAANNRITWVVVGGESGPGARPFDLAWARSVIAQCAEAGTACFVKQLGAFPIADRYNVDGLLFSQLDSTDRGVGPHHITVNIRDRKGAAMIDWPADLRVRQWPGESR